MKKSYYVLILFFISTIYLFSQDVIEEKINLGNSLYKSYLDKPHSIYSMRNITEINDDTLVTKKEKIGILIAKLGGINWPTGWEPYISFAVKVPIFNKFHIISEYSVVTNYYISPENREIYDQYGIFSIMYGYYFYCDKKITTEISTGVCIMGSTHGISGLSLPIDVDVYYKLLEHIILAFGIDYYHIYGEKNNTKKIAFSLGLGFYLN